jgi:hypothetical protein
MSIDVRNRLRLAVAALALVLLALTLQASRADANTPILHYSTLPSTSQAGGHPDVAVSLKLANRLVQESESLCNCEDAKDATVHFPPGLIGNPSATPKCSIADFSADDCPIDSQIGMTFVITGPGIPLQFLSAIYNLVPPPGVAGLTGFKLSFFDSAQFTVLSSRTDSDYGLDAKAISIFHGSGTPLWVFKELLWGVPADPSHNALRINLNEGNIFAGGSTLFGEEFCDADGAPSGDDPRTMVKACGGGNPAPSNSPLTPFLQNPTSCEEPLETTFDVLSYDGETTHAAASWPQATGCNQLSFNPSLYAQPTTKQTDSASGIDVNLSVPQQLSPTVPSPSELKAATVNLPAGFSINSNAVDGKTSCSDAQANFGTRIAAECPEFAKVGSLELLSSALPGPLPGFVYLGSPLPGNRYRLFLVADGFATHVKLAGTVTPDPVTGQLTIDFPSLPQTPLTAFNMHFFGSERGALATPTKCGTYAVQSTFVPWDSRLEQQTSSQFFTLDSGPGGAPCPQGARRFEPTFKAASTGNTAGARTPFALELARPDGDQNLAGLTVTAPPGLTASLRGVPYCPEPAIAKLSDPGYTGLSELAASSCPSASLIGTATAGAGAGSRPLHVQGKVYLAGPYKGSPISIVVVVPAVSGPYDLGNVAVRAAIQVDPETAQVTAISDPLPQILEGVPLRLRSLQVSLDRPEFAINPTNCDAFAVSGTLFGNEGGRVTRSDPYQVGNCASLPYQPSLSMELSGGLLRLGHPAIHAVLKTNPGEANSRRVSVTLPQGQQLDNNHIGTVCTRVDFAAKRCPVDSLVGKAEVTTPLLDRPLSGPIYLRTSNHELPDLALDLTGQFSITALGRVDSVHARLRTVFETIPDVPVSRIDVMLMGGRKGLVVNGKSLCDGPRFATVKMTGQNGASLMSKSRLRANCRKAERRKRSSRRGGGK